MTRHSTGYGAYAITPLPGQPQVAVCHDFMLPQNSLNWDGDDTSPNVQIEGLAVTKRDRSPGS
jgi:hypothetical protein